MPVVPTTTGRQVESRGVQTNGFSTFQTPQTGEMLAGVTEQYTAALGQAKQRANVAMMQDASLQLSGIGNDLLNNPQTGFLNLQGKNAIGKAPEYVQQFNSQVESIAATLPDEQAKKAFLQQAQQQRIQFETQANRHEVGQVRQYEAGMQDGTLKALSQQAMQPGMFTPSLYNAYDSIIAYGKAHGQSDQEIEGNFVQWREQAANRASEAWYNPMYQQMMGPEGKIEVTNTPKEAQLFSAMIWHESGGNQFGKDGAPLVSPKGAVGVAQVTEDTGPEAARLAGLPWDREKWLNDPRYNVQLGKAYFGAQMQKYDNNPVLAVAAYNAGPGAVDGWIKQLGDPRTGEVSNAQFAAAIPYDETRNYVAKVTGSAGAIPGNATMENLINQPFWNAMSPQNNIVTGKQNGDGFGSAQTYAIGNTGLSIGGAYTASDRTTAQTAQTLAKGSDKAEAWATGMKYDANNVYLALMYSETRNMTPISGLTSAYTGAANKTQNFEAVAQYQFDFGLRPSIAYVSQKAKDIEGIGNQDLVKYIDLGATYYFNKNMSAFVDYKINKIDKTATTTNLKLSTDDIVAVGVTYQF